MNAKLLALLVATLGLTVLSGCGGNPQARGEESAENEGSGDVLTLAFAGNPETEFSGTCAVGDAEPEELGGRPPQSFTYDLEGKLIECEIASEGGLEVALTHDNNRSVQRMSGGTLNLAYENGSVSTSTSSSSSSSISSRVVSSSGGPEQTDRSGNATSESRDVSGFDEVELGGVGNLSIRQTGTESLAVEAEEDVLPKIRTEVVDDRLIIGPEPNTSIQTDGPINYELNVEDLQALALSGSGSIDADDVSVDNLAVTVDGTGTVKISGRADSQEVSVSGSGEYRAENLESKEAKIDVGGAGSAIVNATEALYARVSGTGSVEYAGDPAVNQEVSGVGRVSRR